MTDEEQNENVSNQSTPGALLSNAREAQGLTQGDIAVNLRLSVQVIKDIEDDDYSHVKAFIYARGYLKSYARQVGIAEQAVLLAFTALDIEDPVTKSQAPRINNISFEDVAIKSQTNWLRYGLIGALLILVILVGYVWHGQKPAATNASLAQPTPIAMPAMQTQPLVQPVVIKTAIEPAAKPLVVNKVKLNPPTKAVSAKKPLPSHVKPNYTLAPATSN